MTRMPWQEKTFGECAELIRETVSPEQVDPDTPYIGLEHIAEQSLSLVGVGRAAEVSSTKFRFRRGDILFGKLRPYFRKVVRAPFDGICSTDIWVVRPKSEIDPGFLFYWMASNEFIDTSMLGSEGTKMPRAKWEFVSRIKRPIPPLPEQRAIAHILGTLDDKIALNRRMNATLEAMARALFKSWFVDFDPVRAKMSGRWKRGESLPGLPAHLYDLFPDRLVPSELGEIPEGWTVGKVADLGKIVTGKTPPTKNPKNYGDEIPFVTIPDMHNKVYVVDTRKKLSLVGAETQKNKYIPPNSICVSCIATPGLVVLTSKKSQTNQQINCVIPAQLSPFFVYGLLKELGDEIRSGGSGGSVFANLSKSRFASLKVLLADSDCIEEFHNLVEPFYKKIYSNQIEQGKLVVIRDIYLEKLIAGKIKVTKSSNTLLPNSNFFHYKETNVSQNSGRSS